MAMSLNTPRSRARGVYAITCDLADTVHLLDKVECVLDAGAAWLQYRNKSADGAQRRAQALALQPLCARYGVPLIINDDWQLARDIGADGAHLGENDGELSLARSTLGETALLGASCYDQADRAQAAVARGASYVAFGAFFRSQTKPNARQASTIVFEQTVTLDVPRVAIGGITPDNGRSLVTAGADLLAVISGIFDARDPAAATRAYLACFRPLSDVPTP